MSRPTTNLRYLRWLRCSVYRSVASIPSILLPSVLSLAARAPINEDDPIEPRNTTAHIELTGDELVVVMTALVELTTGAALIERRDQVVSVTLENRDGGVGLR